MTFHEWKQRSKAYRKAMNEARDDTDAKKIESLCRAAFTAGVDWGLETYEVKISARRTALHNVEFSSGPAGQSNNLGGRGPSAVTQG